MGSELCRDGDVSVRSFEPGEGGDLPNMLRWLSDPRVLEWYEGRDTVHTAETIAEEYGPGGEHEKEGVLQAIIELSGESIGYVQYYPVGQWAAEYEIEDATDTWAIDVFIGEPEQWGKGIGSRALRALLPYLFGECDARRVLIDPRVVNERAIRSYEKAGFRKVKVLTGHEEHEGEKWDCWLMEALRE